MDVTLSKVDWTEAALRALERDGLGGVAIEPLARQLGATKGSFYWHFADRGELITATLELWERRDTTEEIDRIRALPDPHARLAALGTDAYAGAARGNAHTAVLAAASDPRVQAVLERVTRTRLEFVEQLYCALGVPVGAARHRARLAYALYLGIGAVRRADPGGDPAGPELGAYLDLALDLMMPPETRTRSSSGRAPS